MPQLCACNADSGTDRHFAERDNARRTKADITTFWYAQQADALVQQAAGRIMQAKQLAPDIPAIDLAVVQSLQNGIYLDIVSGALSE